MKSLLACCLFSAAIFPTAFANIYSGTITQTITDTNNPLYSVGQTFVGSYEYEANGVDGSFYTPVANAWISPADLVNYAGTADAIGSLGGQVYLALSDYHAGYNDINNTSHLGALTVAKGIVSNFLWIWEAGEDYSYLSGNTFTSWQMQGFDQTNGALLPTLTTNGTLTFGAPEVVNGAGGVSTESYSVAETGNTFVMLFMALGLMAIFVRRRSLRSSKSA